MSKKVFLGVGHGGSDPGAVGYIKEADVNLAMALACRDYLEANGIEVKISRTTDENDSLTEEIKECNAFRPDLAVDIHNNAGGGDGFECYYHYKGGISETLAKNIESEVKAIGQNSRGCKIRLNSSGTDYYGFIRQTNCPAVICEGVFVDNQADAAQADTKEEQSIFGIAYAKGILKTLGAADNRGSSTGGGSETTAKPVQAPSSQPAERSYVHTIGEHIVFSNCYATSTDPVGKAIPASKMARNHGTITKIVDAANPYLLDNGMCWVNDGDICGAYTVSEAAPQPQVSYYPKCVDNNISIVDALKSIGVDSSFVNRQKIAVKNGISDYKGSADQNNKLLSLLKGGKLIR